MLKADEISIEPSAAPKPVAVPLREKFKSGVLWITAFSVFRDLLQFVMMLVLVRILQPSAYGQFGLVTSIVGFFTVISFRPFLEHTLQLRPHEPVNYQMHFTAGAFIQVFIFVIVNVLAVVLRHLNRYAEIAPLVHMMSLFFLLDWACELRIKMLERSLDWKRLRLLQGGALLLCTATGIVLAICGFGVWALMVPCVVITFPAVFDLFVTEGWRPNWTWDREAFRPAWRYGVARIGSGLVLNGRQLLESTILVQLLGFAAFGIYGRAIGLATMCCLKLPLFLTLTLYPVLTRMEPNTSRYIKACGLALQIVAWTVIPIAVLFSRIAEPLINVLYGQKWSAVMPLLPWAMGWATCAALAQTASMLLLANLQQKRCFVGDVLVLVGTAVSLFLLVRIQVIDYLIGITATQIVCLALLLFWLHQGHAVLLSGLRDAILWPVCGSVVAFAVCEAIRYSLHIGSNTLVFAVGYGTIFAFIYVLFLRLASAPLMGELVTYFPGAPYFRRLFLLEPAV